MEYGLISQIANDSETFKWKDSIKHHTETIQTTKTLKSSEWIPCPGIIDIICCSPTISNFACP